METIGKLIITLINIFILARYCWLIIKKKISPSLAMWFFFTLAVSISLITYLSEGDFSLLDNVLNTTDLILVSSITIVIFFFGDKTTKFNKFDLVCLAAVLLIIIFWLISKTHFLSHLLTQIIMIIAYFPVIKKMINMKKNTEPFSVWIALLLAPIISLFVSNGSLAIIYSIRTIICTCTLLILMIILEFRTRNIQKSYILRGQI